VFKILLDTLEVISRRSSHQSLDCCKYLGWTKSNYNSYNTQKPKQKLCTYRQN